MSFVHIESATVRGPAVPLEDRLVSAAARAFGAVALAAVALLWLSLVSWSVSDPSLTHATSGEIRNLMGPLGAIVSDLLLQTFGFASVVVLFGPLFWGLEMVFVGRVQRFKSKLAFMPLALGVLAGAFSSLPVAASWPLHHGFGGILGDAVYGALTSLLAMAHAERAGAATGLMLFAAGFAALFHAIGIALDDVVGAMRAARGRQSASVAPASPSAFGRFNPDALDLPEGLPVAGRPESPAPYHDLDESEPPHADFPHANVRGAPEAAGYQPVGRYPQHAFGQPEPPLPVREPAAYVPPFPPGPGVQRYPSRGPAAALAPTRGEHPPVNRSAVNGPMVNGYDGRARSAGGQYRDHAAPHDMGSPDAGSHVASTHVASTHGTGPLDDASLGASRFDAHPVDTPLFDSMPDEASRRIAARFAPSVALDSYPESHSDAPAASAFVDSSAPLTAGHTQANAPSSPGIPLSRPATPHAAASPSQHPVQPLVQQPATRAELRKEAEHANKMRMASGRPDTRTDARPDTKQPTRAEAAAAMPQPVKRNALFGGLTFRHQGEPMFRRPQLNLLRKPAPAKSGPELAQAALRGNARLLEDVLADFGVKGEIRDIRPGPVVTLFEVEPARGTKSSRVIGLADDIARSMSANAVRVAVVPGRNAIGIELPNPRRETVLLRELLESETYKATEHTLPIVLGKAIGGEPVIADLARMPHLLIAGTTGSGKSVGVNAMILSLLYRLTPEECRFIMIDPKMLELSVYNGIPHLLTPVVTDPAKAVAALNWAVSEMEERYKRMAKLAVRNIDVFNNRVRNAKKRGEMLARTVQTGFDAHTGQAVFEQEKLDLEPMPYIVVVIDEFADLMLVAGKEVEAAVQRLAQMARAAGIHIVMATQRPSVDVITGTIKANFPTRISFKVASKIDSRTILNEAGAEQLLGQGDMLYTSGNGQLLRVHGPYVADEEVETVAAALRDNGPPDYVAGIAEPPATPEKGSGARGGEDARGQSEQDLYDRAVAVVLRDRKVSTSYIQRRLSIGYNRAADLVERMEREGLIGPASATGKRDILGCAGGVVGTAEGDAT